MTAVSKPGGKVREDKRPASIYDANARKKCGHCQDMKPCVEFSADVSRGDGLRGWCKVCEAEARSDRYKKRKAAALESSSARHRLEQPLGGMPTYHYGSPAAAATTTSEPLLPLHAQQQPAPQQQLPPLSQQQQFDEFAQQQRQRQQQAAVDVAYLHRQLTAWRAQQQVTAVAAAAAASAPQLHASAFRPVPQRPSPRGALLSSLDIGASFGASSHPRSAVTNSAGSSAAAAAYIAAAAAQRRAQRQAPQHFAMPAVPLPAPGKGSRPASPGTSDSEISAGEILTGMKHSADAGGGSGQLSPQQQRRGRRNVSPPAPESLWRASGTSEDSVMGTLADPGGFFAAGAFSAAAEPLPPAEQPHVPRRSRTKGASAFATAAAAAAAAAAPAAQKLPTAALLQQLQQAQPQRPGEVAQWSAQLLACIMTMRAAGGCMTRPGLES